MYYKISTWILWISMSKADKNYFKIPRILQAILEHTNKILQHHNQLHTPCTGYSNFSNKTGTYTRTISPYTIEVQQLLITLITATIAVLIKPLVTNICNGITLNHIQSYTALFNIFITSSSTNRPGDCSIAAPWVLQYHLMDLHWMAMMKFAW